MLIVVLLWVLVWREETQRVKSAAVSLNSAHPHPTPPLHMQGRGLRLHVELAVREMLNNMELICVMDSLQLMR